MSEIRNPELLAIADNCVACGLCVPQCPSYQVLQNEADSPRGRIALMRGLLEQKLQPTARLQQHLDQCLTCRQCEKVCPNQVAYGRLVDGMRAELLQQQPGRLPWLKRKSLNWLALRPQWWRRLLKLARFPFAGSLLRRLRQALTVLPTLQEMQRRYQSRHWQDCYSSIGEMRGEVMLFLGCLARAVDVEAIDAAIHLLNLFGFRVWVPQAQVCCGAMLKHAGDAAGAARLHAINRRVFAGEMPLLTLASGCGADLYDADDTDFGARVVEIATFLEQHADWRLVECLPLAGRVTVHDPCTLRNVMRSEQAYHRLLQRIPGLQLVPLAGNQQCCGAAGTYHLQHPQIARQLRDDKISAIKATGAEHVCSANFACGMWLNTAQDKAQQPVQHPLLLLQQQIRKVSSC